MNLAIMMMMMTTKTMAIMINQCVIRHGSHVQFQDNDNDNYDDGDDDNDVDEDGDDINECDDDADDN